MAIEVRWSEKPAVHLQHIYDYISFDSVFYADRFITSLIKSTEAQLSEYPLLGRSIPEFDDTPLNFLKK